MTPSSHSYPYRPRTGAGIATTAARDEAAMLAVSGHLTNRDRDLIRCVARHRVLTTDQLAALAFTNLTTARHRLTVLVGLGVLRRFRPRREVGSAPWHYVLGPIGAALLGTEDRDANKWVSQVRADRQLALERSQRLDHLIGVNWFFVALHQRERDGGGQLAAWYGEREAADFLYAGQPVQPDEPHPDGLGIWAQDGRDICFLLEYDTGTEHLPQLTEKLPGYAQMARQQHVGFRAPLLFCFPTPRREQTARSALAATSASFDLQIATTALDPARTCPAGPVWMTLHGGHGPMRLIDLATVLPDPWRTARQQDERERRDRHDLNPYA